jgi:hypothetical protein
MSDFTKTRMKLSPEYELLLSCAKVRSNGKIKERLPKILNLNLDWPYILDESIKQGTVCLLYENLSKFNEYVPAEIRNKLKDAYYLNASRNILIANETSRVLSLFNKESLKAIPLKGIFLAENFYGNIALRTMNDIDILIKFEDLSKANSILAQLGYRSTINKELLSSATEKSYLNSVDYNKATDDIASYATTLHIHWHIVNVSLPTYLYTKYMNMGRFWQDATPAKITDIETLQLSACHLIIYLSEHALKHSFDKLILFTDIDTVFHKFSGILDWGKLIKESKEFGMERQVFYSLYFTRYFLGTDIPEHVLSELKPKKIGIFEQWFFKSISNNKRNAQFCYFVYLGMVDGLINKLKFVFRTILPPPEALALFSNLDKKRITITDYLYFFKKRFSRMKRMQKNL